MSFICYNCGKEFRSEPGLNIHIGATRHNQRPDEEIKVNLHLSLEDCFSRSTIHAAHKNTQREDRYLHRSAERFHRRVLRAKAGAIARRAEKHGWVGKKDLRSRGDNQL